MIDNVKAAQMTFETPSSKIFDLVSNKQNKFDNKRDTESYSGKVVLVTGAGGSIGSKLCEELVQMGLKHLILIETSEYAAHKVMMDLNKIISETSSEIALTSVLGSVQDKQFLDVIFGKFHPDLVIHAAAFKHVPIVENNPVEGAKNNILGTLNIANVCVRQNVKNVVLVSTDKAVRPSNIMGATKRVAELIFDFYQQENPHFFFSKVRFGNVFGSSGSVVPIFEEQIVSGRPLTITHVDVERYFMSIQEAAQLVIKASLMSGGGETFVLNMGKAVKILDLCKAIAEMHGRTVYLSGEEKPDPTSILIKQIGLRKGEKLCEELFITASPVPTESPDIFKEEAFPFDRNELKTLLQRIYASIEAYDQDGLEELYKDSMISFSQ